MYKVKSKTTMKELVIYRIMTQILNMTSTKEVITVMMRMIQMKKSLILRMGVMEVVTVIMKEIVIMILLMKMKF